MQRCKGTVGQCWCPGGRAKGTFVLKLTAMAMSWCIQLASCWGMQLAFAQVEIVTDDLTFVINAFFLSTMSVILIIVFDKLADRVQESNATLRRIADAGANNVFDVVAEGDESDGGHDGHLPRSARTDATGWTDAAESHGSFSKRPLAVAAGEECGAGPADIPQSDSDLQLLTASEIGAVLRVIISSFGLLVALAWDKAFDVACEAIVEAVGSHPVISKVALASLLVTTVAPTWRWYIVPQAIKTPADHRADMRTDAQVEDAMRTQFTKEFSVPPFSESDSDSVGNSNSSSEAT